MIFFDTHGVNDAVDNDFFSWEEAALPASQYCYLVPKLCLGTPNDAK
jgi:hypothetical protein